MPKYAEKVEEEDCSDERCSVHTEEGRSGQHSGGFLESQHTIGTTIYTIVPQESPTKTIEAQTSFQFGLRFGNLVREFATRSIYSQTVLLA